MAGGQDIAALQVGRAAMSDVPSVYGMGCAVSGDTLFALGGNQGTLGFRLDIKLPALANWTSFDVDEEIGMYPSVAPHERGLIVVGGDRSLNGSPVRYFSSKTRRLKQGPTMARKEVGMLMKASLVQNDLVPTEYISFGGKQVQMRLPAMRMYDAKQEKWRLMALKSRKTYPEDRIAAVSNGVLYVVVAGPDSTSADTVRTYDIQKKTWGTETTTGTPAPLVPGLAVAQNGSAIFAVLNSSLFVLDLPTLQWSQHEIPGLEGRTHGCLAHTKGHLIHAFGLATDTVPSNTTQLIDLKRMALVDPASQPLPQKEASNQTLFYMFLGIFLGVVMLLLLVYHVRRRKPPTQSPHPEF